MKLDAPRRAVTLDEVRAHREEIVHLAERFGVRNIRIFGSVARGEATSDSDLDLLVDVDRGHGYIDMAGFALGVEDQLGVFTQVATTRGLKVRIRDRVLREAVPLLGVTASGLPTSSRPQRRSLCESAKAGGCSTPTRMSRSSWCT